MFQSFLAGCLLALLESKSRISPLQLIGLLGGGAALCLVFNVEIFVNYLLSSPLLVVPMIGDQYPVLAVVLFIAAGAAAYAHQYVATRMASSEGRKGLQELLGLAKEPLKPRE